MCIRDRVEADYKGKKSTRLKWPCISNLKGEDGQHLVVNLFTGTGLTDHPADLHRQLVEDGFGLDADEYEDTDEIVGQMFSGKVEHKKETGRAAIVKFDTKERCQKVKGKKKAEVDPFENE